MVIGVGVFHEDKHIPARTEKPCINLNGLRRIFPARDRPQEAHQYGILSFLNPRDSAFWLLTPYIDEDHSNPGSDLSDPRRPGKPAPPRTLYLLNELTLEGRRRVILRFTFSQYNRGLGPASF